MKKIFNKVSRKYKRYMWELGNFYRKKEHIIYPVINVCKEIIKVIVIIIGILIVLQEFGVISISFNNGLKNIVILNNIDFETWFIDLCIAQISITFLTTAILSLVSSLENKYILGEKITDLIFGKSLVKFYLPMTILYICMIINIILIIKKTNANLLLLFFAISILTLIYITNKVGGIFVSTKKYRVNLYCKYYKECERNIINRIPPKDYDSKLLENFKEQTIKKIIEEDTSYVLYINMYKILIDRLLFNKAEELQKYHLDMEYAPSIINDFMEIIEHFIYTKNYNRAIQYYTWILERFNFHNVYICYKNISYLFKVIANKLLDLNNEFEVIEYIRHVAPLVTEIEVQQHFALNNDYAYTNLTDFRINYMHFHDSLYFEHIYNKIFINKYLSKSEKARCFTELFNTFRMSGHNGCNFIRDITNFSFEFKKGKDRKMIPLMLGQATTLLLLRTLYNKDEENFKLFIGMNLEEEEMRFAIHTLFLSLMKIENECFYKNIFSEFCGLDIEWAKKFIKENVDFIFNSTDRWVNHKLLENLQEDYEYILSECIDKENERNALFLNYLLKYDIELINQYFTEISSKYDKKVKVKSKKHKEYKAIIDSYLN